MRWKVVTAVLLLAGSGLAAVMAWAGAAGVEPGHTPLHIGCRHHNHGPAWHARHKDILGGGAGRLGRSGGAADADAPARPAGTGRE